MLNLFLSIAAPLAAGLLLVRLAWRPGAGIHTCVLQFVLGSGLAVGISSCTFFLWLARPFSMGIQFAVAEPVFLFCAVAACLAFKKPRRAVLTNLLPDPFASLPGDVADTDRIPKRVLVGFYVVLACAIAALILVFINKPHGGGDSYGIWNLRARFLFRGHEEWTRGFSSLISWSHPDYPLLIPSSIARVWTYLGFDTPRVPQLIAAFFTLGTATLLFSSLAVFRSANKGLSAVLFLMATTYFVRLSGTQYADIPTGFFILTTIVLLALRDATDGEHPGLLCLAGMAAGFAAWTKNEGMLFVFSILAARFVVLIIRSGYKSCFRESGFFLVGLLPVLGILFYFKLRYAPPSDLFGSHDFELMVRKLSDLHRYVLVAKAFGNEILRWGNGLTAVFVVYAIAGGIKLNRRYLTTVAMDFIMLALMIIGYFFVYVLTPYDLKWHLGSSLERLFLQLWPTFLFVFFLIVSPGEDHSEDLLITPRFLGQASPRTSSFS